MPHKTPKHRKPGAGSSTVHARHRTENVLSFACGGPRGLTWSTTIPQMPGTWQPGLVYPDHSDHKTLNPDSRLIVLYYFTTENPRLKSGAVFNVTKARMVPGSLIFGLRNVYC